MYVIASSVSSVHEQLLQLKGTPRQRQGWLVSFLKSWEVGVTGISSVISE